MPCGVGKGEAEAAKLPPPYRAALLLEIVRFKCNILGGSLLDDCVRIVSVLMCRKSGNL